MSYAKTPSTQVGTPHTQWGSDVAESRSYVPPSTVVNVDRFAKLRALDEGDKACGGLVRSNYPSAGTNSTFITSPSSTYPDTFSILTTPTSATPPHSSTVPFHSSTYIAAYLFSSPTRTLNHSILPIGISVSQPMTTQPQSPEAVTSPSRRVLSLDPQSMQEVRSLQPGSVAEERLRRHDTLRHQQSLRLPEVLRRADALKDAPVSASLSTPNLRQQPTEESRRSRGPDAATRYKSRPPGQSRQPKAEPVTVKCTVTPVDWPHPNGTAVPRLRQRSLSSTSSLSPGREASAKPPLQPGFAAIERCHAKLDQISAICKRQGDFIPEARLQRERERAAQTQRTPEGVDHSPSRKGDKSTHISTPSDVLSRRKADPKTAAIESWAATLPRVSIPTSAKTSRVSEAESRSDAWTSPASKGPSHASTTTSSSPSTTSNVRHPRPSAVQRQKSRPSIHDVPQEGSSGIKRPRPSHAGSSSGTSQISAASSASCAHDVGREPVAKSAVTTGTTLTNSTTHVKGAKSVSPLAKEVSSTASSHRARLPEEASRAHLGESVRTKTAKLEEPKPLIVNESKVTKTSHREVLKKPEKYPPSDTKNLRIASEPKESPASSPNTPSSVVRNSPTTPTASTYRAESRRMTTDSDQEVTTPLARFFAESVIGSTATEVDFEDTKFTIPSGSGQQKALRNMPHRVSSIVGGRLLTSSEPRLVRAESCTSLKASIVSEDIVDSAQRRFPVLSIHDAVRIPGASSSEVGLAQPLDPMHISFPSNNASETTLSTIQVHSPAEPRKRTSSVPLYSAKMAPDPPTKRISREAGSPPDYKDTLPRTASQYLEYKARQADPFNLRRVRAPLRESTEIRLEVQRKKMIQEARASLLREQLRIAKEKEREESGSGGIVQKLKGIISGPSKKSR